MGKFNSEENIWGNVPQIEIIKSDLRDFILEGCESIQINHIESGFTNNVFLLRIDNKRMIRKVILKQCLKEWHKREIKIYDEILSNDPELSAPDLLYWKDDRMYLEYLEPLYYQNFTSHELEYLYKWLIYKHKKYNSLTKIRNKYIEDEEIRKHYLLEKPLEVFHEVSQSKLHEVSLSVDRIERLLSSSKKLTKLFDSSDKFDLTLEHGDLEPQNLMFSKKYKELRVIDWTNAKFSDGLTDINQFLENCSRYSIDKEIYLKEFQFDLKIKDFSYKLKINRLFMLLNKLHYYLRKFQLGEQVSKTNGQKILDLVNEYSKESISLLEEL